MKSNIIISLFYIIVKFYTITYKKLTFYFLVKLTFFTSYILLVMIKYNKINDDIIPKTAIISEKDCFSPVKTITKQAQKLVIKVKIKPT